MRFTHLRIAIHSRGVGGKRQTETNRNIVEIHVLSPFSLSSCIQHVLNENTMSGGRLVHKDMVYRTDGFVILDDKAAAYADVK